MMGDGAAVARLSRQPRTQRTRRGPASAPQATRASIVALPGSACHPEVAGCVLGSARLAPAPRGVLRSPCSIASASQGAGAHNGVPRPNPSRPAPLLRVLAGPGNPFVYLKPWMHTQPLATPGEVWMQRKQGRADARCGRLGWKCAGSPGPSGEGRGVRPARGVAQSDPPLSSPPPFPVPSVFPLLFTFPIPLLPPATSGLLAP